MTAARRALLVLALLTTVGCGSAQRFRIPPGEQVAQLATVGLRAEVTEIINYKHKLVVNVNVENEGDVELRFKRAAVSMEIEGRRHEARDVRAWEIDVDVVPGQVKAKSWGFHAGKPTPAGTYELTITGIDTWDGAERTPTGVELVLPVTVPGSPKRG